MALCVRREYTPKILSLANAKANGKRIVRYGVVKAKKPAAAAATTTTTAAAQAAAPPLPPAAVAASEKENSEKKSFVGTVWCSPKEIVKRTM